MQDPVPYPLCMSKFEVISFYFSDQTPDHVTDFAHEDVQFKSRNASSFEIYATTEQQLEVTRLEVRILERDLAEVLKSAEDVRKKLHKKKAEAGHLEKKRIEEIQDRNWGQLSRELIGTDFDAEASDIFYTLKGLKKYKEMTKAASLFECIGKLLPTECVQGLEPMVMPLSRKLSLISQNR